MSQKFHAVIHHRDDISFVKLSGVIDEDNDLRDLAEKLHRKTVVVELSEVDRINSYGVRDWVNWLARVESRSQVVLVECSPAIVSQINLVQNFVGGAIVKSFYVPYFCAECDEEKALLCEAADLGPPPHEPPTCRCDECDLVMAFDDLADSYFAFLASQAPTAVMDEVNSLIEDLGADDSRIRSRVGTLDLGQSRVASSLPSVPSLPSISIMRSGARRASSSDIAELGGEVRFHKKAVATHGGPLVAAPSQTQLQTRFDFDEEDVENDPTTPLPPQAPRAPRVSGSGAGVSADPGSGSIVYVALLALIIVAGAVMYYLMG